MRVWIGLFALLFVAGSAQAAFLSDGMNTGSYVSATEDLEGHYGDSQWAGGGFKVLDGPQSSLPAEWKAAQPDWNGDHFFHVEPDTSLKVEGDASMKITANTPYNGYLNDIMIGRVITGLTPGEQYNLSFQFQIDEAHRNQSGPGLGTGDDFVNSVSWGVRGAVGNINEDFGLGMDSPRVWGDMEDYPGHERSSIWINDWDTWDGAFHLQQLDFIPLTDTVVFALKFRSAGAGLGSMRLDDLVVVPEPAALTLFALGGLAVLRRRAR